MSLEELILVSIFVFTKKCLYPIHGANREFLFFRLGINRPALQLKYKFLPSFPIGN